MPLNIKYSFYLCVWRCTVFRLIKKNACEPTSFHFDRFSSTEELRIPSSALHNWLHTFRIPTCCKILHCPAPNPIIGQDGLTVPLFSCFSAFHTLFSCHPSSSESDLACSRLVITTVTFEGRSGSSSACACVCVHAHVLALWSDMKRA